MRTLGVGMFRKAETFKAIVPLAILLAGCSQPSPPQPERAAPSTPSFNDPAVTYPNGLAEAARKCCGDFHLPQRNEVHGAWMDSDGEGSVPFLVQGDFNGDGLKDAAALLVSASGSAALLVVFEGAAQDYRLAHRRPLDSVGDVTIAAPQEIVLRLIRKGEEWAPESGDVPQDYVHAHDAIPFETRKVVAHGLIHYQHLIYWDGKQYAEY